MAGARFDGLLVPRQSGMSCLSGKSVTVTASELGVRKQTLYNWMHDAEVVAGDREGTGNWRQPTSKGMLDEKRLFLHREHK